MKSIATLAVSAFCVASALGVAPTRVFPGKNGDLANAAHWGSWGLPDETVNVQISSNGTYTLSSDLDIGSMTLSAAQVEFDFREGNHTLTLHKAEAEWSGWKSLFRFDHTHSKPKTTLRGGMWYSPNEDAFYIVSLGWHTSDVDPNKYSFTFTMTNSCVITNVGASAIRRQSNTRVTIADSSRFHGKSMTMRSVAYATNNVLDIFSGGAMHLSGDFLSDVNDSSWTYGMSGCLIDVHGAGSMLTAGGKMNLGDHAGGFGLRVRDGATVAVTNALNVSATGSSSNNWIEVTDGASLSAQKMVLNSHDNRILVSNATFRMTHATSYNAIFALGATTNAHHNTMTVTGPETVFKARADSDNDLISRFGHHNTFELMDGAKWFPEANATFLVTSNSVFRISGPGTVFSNAVLNVAAGGTTSRQTFLGFSSDSSRAAYTLTNTWNNTMEISDGAHVYLNRFFVHGHNQTVVVSNATLTAGSLEGTGGAGGFGVWMGRGSSSNCVLVLRGSTPKIRPAFPDRQRVLQLQSWSVLRYEIPREGYPDGHVAIEMQYIYPVSYNPAKDRIEIECSEWAARRDNRNRELILFRGYDSFSSSFKTWFNGLNLNLPPNVKCFVRGKDLVLRRDWVGMRVIVR